VASEYPCLGDRHSAPRDDCPQLKPKTRFQVSTGNGGRIVTGIPTISIEELARNENYHSRGDFTEMLGAILKAEGCSLGKTAWSSSGVKKQKRIIRGSTNGL
jgi:hypothetical protein